MKQFAIQVFLSLALPFLVVTEYDATHYDIEAFDKVNIYIAYYSGILFKSGQAMKRKEPLGME